MCVCVCSVNVDVDDIWMNNMSITCIIVYIIHIGMCEFRQKLKVS